MLIRASSSIESSFQEKLRNVRIVSLYVEVDRPAVVVFDSLTVACASDPYEAFHILNLRQNHLALLSNRLKTIYKYINDHDLQSLRKVKMNSPEDVVEYSACVHKFSQVVHARQDEFLD